jgi:hypothetical protein
MAKLSLFALYVGQNPVTDEVCARFARMTSFFDKFVAEFAEHLNAKACSQGPRQSRKTIEIPSQTE